MELTLNLKSEYKQVENKDLGGVEIYFTSMPAKEDRNVLKDNKFKWNHLKKCWYKRVIPYKDMIKRQEEPIQEEKKKEPTYTKKYVGISYEKISREIDKILKGDYDALKLLKLKKEIDDTILMTTSISSTNDKKQLQAIKRYLDNISEEYPVLKTFSPIKDAEGKIKTVVCDKYTLFILNRDVLPFNVSQSKEFSEEEFKDYCKEHEIDKLRIKSGVYPALDGIIPNKNDSIGKVKINVKEVLAKNKVSSKHDIVPIVFTIKDNEDKEHNITLDAHYLKNLIDILGITDNEIELNFYGDYKSLDYENKNGYGLVLPIKTY